MTFRISAAAMPIMVLFSATTRRDRRCPILNVRTEIAVQTGSCHYDITLTGRSFLCKL